MGFNTVVLIQNDALSFIQNDPNFAKNLIDAINSPEVYKGEQKDVPAYSYSPENLSEVKGIHCNAATVITSHHADMKSIIVVGGNCANVLGTVFGCNDGTHENNVKMLKDLAEQLGYSIRRNNPKK